MQSTQTNLSEFIVRAERASPNMMLGNEVSGSGNINAFVLRVTDDKLLLGHIEAFCDAIGEKYLCVKETSKKDKVHYHATFITVDYPIEEVRGYLKETFPQLNSGHKYNLQESDINDNSRLIYLLKDVEDFNDHDVLRCKGYTYDQLENFKKQSYKKFSKETFMKDLDQLEQDFYKRPVTQHVLLMKLAELKCVKYNQNPNWNHMIAWTERVMLKSKHECLKDEIKAMTWNMLSRRYNSQK